MPHVVRWPHRRVIPGWAVPAGEHGGVTVTGGQRRARTGPSAGPGRPPGLDVLPLAHAAGAVAAFQAAAASLVLVLGPVVLTWVVTGGGDASWLEVVQIATMLWLLAQHAALAMDGGQLALVPIGLTAVPLLACAYAGTRLARSLDPQAERIASGSSRAVPQAAPRAALVTMGVTHGLIGVLIAALLATPALRPVVWQAFAGPALVALAGGWFGSAAYVHGGARAALAGLLARLPHAVRRLTGPVWAALLVQCAAAVIAVLACIVVGFGRILDLYQALGGGALGAAMITLLQVTLLPNLVIWAAAVLAGPGFAVGAGTEVSPLTTTLGPLPALPILGALPAPGAKPGYWLVLLVIPLIAGAVAAHRLLAERAERADDPRLPALVRDVLGVALLGGVVGGVLSWLSGGDAGPGRLSEVGPTPYWVAAAFGAELAIGATLLLLVRLAAPRTAEALAGLRARYRRDL